MNLSLNLIRNSSQRFPNQILSGQIRLSSIIKMSTTAFIEDTKQHDLLQLVNQHYLLLVKNMRIKSNTIDGFSANGA